MSERSDDPPNARPGPGAGQTPSDSVLRRLSAAMGTPLHGVDVPDLAEDADATRSAEPTAPGIHNPRFRVLGEIARGGVGIVYKARDEDLGRSVAMKVLRPGFAGRADVLARFVEEARIGGQLQHPGVVPVYEMGLAEDGLPFFAMKLIRGRTLADVLAARQSPEDDRRRVLGIVEQVCQTIAYAHARRVIHRDLKPANVLVGDYGEVQVADWGFAKVLGEQTPAAGSPPAREDPAAVSRIEVRRDDSRSDHPHSTSGSVFGTPAYMPPEQALGQVERLDARSDVFSLGAILCEVLTGSPPYPGDDALPRAARAELGDARARLARCGAEPELVELTRECLQPESARRPTDAAAVAARLGDHLGAVEERTRQAEIRAASARIRTRFTAALAGLVLLGSLGGAGAWIELDRRETARIQTLRDRFDEAFAEARDLSIEVRAAGGYDADTWKRALDAAERAIARADELPAQNASTAKAATRKLHDALERDRAAAEQDAARAASERNAREAAAALEAARQSRIERFLTDLDALRIPPDDDPAAEGFELREARRLAAAYAAAFRRWLEGDELLELDTDAAVRRLTDPAIRVEAALALDHWKLQRWLLFQANDRPAADAQTIEQLARLAGRVDEISSSAGDFREELRMVLDIRVDLDEELPDLITSLVAEEQSLGESAALLVGDHAWARGLDADAVRVWERGALEHPDSFPLCLRLGLAAEIDSHRSREPRERAEAAARRYETAHALRPDLLQVRHRQGLALQRAGRLEDALVVFEDLARRQPDEAHWHRHAAGVLLDLDRTDAALIRARTAVELAPEGADERAALARVLGARGDDEAALEAWRRAAELAPDRAVYQYDLGTALLGLGDHGKAAERFEAAVELDPSLAPAWYGLGMARSALADHEAALEAYDRAVDADPLEARAHTNAAVLLHHLGRDDEARQRYRAALAIEPDQLEALFGLGGLLIVDERPEAAVPLLERALRIDPDRYAARLNLAMALSDLGRFDEALALLAVAIRSRPADAGCQVTRGLVLRQAGRVEESQAAYLRAVEIDPGSAVALRNLGEIAEQGGRFRLAARRYREAAAAFGQQEGAFATRWRQRSQRDAVRLDDLLDRRDAALPILSGSRDGRDADEWFSAVQVAHTFGDHEVAVETAVRALRALPDAFDVEGQRPLRRLAASSAARSIDSALDADAPRLRRYAYEWLRHVVDHWRTAAGAGGERAELARRQLEELLEDPAFEVLRENVQGLPRAERANWLVLWSDVRRTLSRREP